ncbi:MAG: O-antigen ligase family protein [bacterium]
MFELKFEKYSRVLLYAAAFLPLIFIQGFYFPFVITRTVFFRLLMQLGLSLYFLLLALNYKKHKPRFSAAIVLVAIFFLVQLAAAIFGLDFYKSFWSDFERLEGVSSLIYLVIYLFLLQAFLKEKKYILFYVRLILISSVLVSLYGLAQKFNIIHVFESGIGRVTSTIGNAAFLAGYLLLSAGLGIYYYFNETEKNYRYFALTAAVLNLATLLLTSTRGAILGLAAGALIFLCLNAIFLSGKARKNSLIILFSIIIFFSGFYLFRANLANSKIEFIRRMATISTGDGSVSNRLFVWQMALKDFKLNPVLGIGMENFEFIYNKYYKPDISENWFDRTHNVYLDQLVSAGILGLAVFLAILFYLFYSLFKIRREDYYKFAVLSSMLAAYAIHNFFVFDTLNTSFLYFFLIFLASFKESFGDAVSAKNAKPDNKLFNKIFVVLIVANIFVFYKMVYLPLKINRAIYVGYYYVVADTFRSYENFKTALNYKLGNVEAAVQLNKMDDIVSEQNDLSASIKEKYLALDKEKLKFASDNFPLDIKTKMYLGQLILNNYENQSELDEAEKLILESQKLSPSRVEPYYLLYNLYSKKGEKQRAREVLEDLIKQLPWYGGAKIMLMGDIYKEDSVRAEELYQQGVKQFGYKEFGGLKKIIVYLLDQERYSELAPYYNKLIQEEPERYDYRLDLAKVFYLSGDVKSALEQINIIKSNSPDILKGHEGFVDEVNSAYNSK